jgi:uncharacterized membrane protein YjdF
MENQEPEKDKANSYYSDRSRRTHDLIGGIFGGIVYTIIAFSILVNTRNYEFMLAFFIIIYLVAIAALFTLKRHYIAIGLISIIILPLLIFGGCMMLINI